MKKLFERMKEEKLNCAVIENWFAEFSKAIAELNVLRENDDYCIYSSSYKRADELYGYLTGVLWALDTTKYITDEFRHECEDELLSMLFC